MIFKLIILLFTHLVLLLLLLSAGHYILRLTFKLVSFSPPIRISISYLLGIAALVVPLKVLTYFFHNARLSTLIVILCISFLLIYEIKKILLDAATLLSKKSFWYIIPLSCVLFFILLIYHLPVSVKDLNAFTSIGSLHSVRYAWITNTIFSKNDILILPQNTVQSILTYLSGELSYKLPYVSLYIWLFTTIFFFVLFIVGIMLEFTSSKRVIVFGLLIYFMGNTAFSLNHLLVVDSGSPFLLVGISDTILGSFSIFVLLAGYSRFMHVNNYLIPFFSSLLILGLNYYGAPQNIIIFYIAIICNIMYSVIRKNPSIKWVYFGFIILLTSSLLFIPQGGMLTPKIFLSNYEYSGIMSPSGSGAGIEIKPGIPYVTGSLNHWVTDTEQYPPLNFIKEYYDGRINLYDFIRNTFWNIWNIESSIINSLRVYFFIILGLLYLIFRHKYFKNDERKVSDVVFNQKFLKHIGYFGIIAFIISFTLCFTFSYNGYKWELSRFMIPSISIGMFGFVLFYIEFLKKSRKQFYFIINFLLIFMLFGPISNFISIVLYKLYILSFSESGISVLKEFLGPGPVL